MNLLTENVEKSKQMANMLRDDVQQAFKAACAVQRPEGQNLYDKALSAFLYEALEMASKLECKLNQL